MRSDDIFCSQDKLLTLRSVLSCTNQYWRWFFVISSFSFTNYFQWFLTFCYITISQWNRKIGILTQLYSTDVTSQLAFTWSKLTMHQKKVWDMFEVKNKNTRTTPMTSRNNSVSIVKGALSGVRLFLATKNPLKLMKNAFCFTLEVLFVLMIFKFLSWLFGHV